MTESEAMSLFLNETTGALEQRLVQFAKMAIERHRAEPVGMKNTNGLTLYDAWDAWPAGTLLYTHAPCTSALVWQALDQLEYIAEVDRYDVTCLSDTSPRYIYGRAGQIAKDAGDMIRKQFVGDKA